MRRVFSGSSVFLCLLMLAAALLSSAQSTPTGSTTIQTETQRQTRQTTTVSKRQATKQPARIDPRSTTPANAGGNTGPAGVVSFSYMPLSKPAATIDDKGILHADGTRCEVTSHREPGLQGIHRDRKGT